MTLRDKAWRFSLVALCFSPKLFCKIFPLNIPQKLGTALIIASCVTMMMWKLVRQSTFQASKQLFHYTLQGCKYFFLLERTCVCLSFHFNWTKKKVRSDIILQYCSICEPANLMPCQSRTLVFALESKKKFSGHSVQPQLEFHRTLANCDWPVSDVRLLFAALLFLFLVCNLFVKIHYNQGLFEWETSQQILTSYPRRTAMWKDSNWSGMTDKIPWRQSTILGTSRVRKACPFTSSSPSLQINMGRPYKWKSTHEKGFNSREILPGLAKFLISAFKKWRHLIY